MRFDDEECLGVAEDGDEGFGGSDVEEGDVVFGEEGVEMLDDVSEDGG